MLPFWQVNYFQNVTIYLNFILTCKSKVKRGQLKDKRGSYHLSFTTRVLTSPPILGKEVKFLKLEIG